MSPGKRRCRLRRRRPEPLPLEALDLGDVEAAAGDDLDVLEALAVEGLSNQVA